MKRNTHAILAGAAMILSLVCVGCSSLGGVSSRTEGYSAGYMQKEMAADEYARADSAPMAPMAAPAPSAPATGLGGFARAAGESAAMDQDGGAVASNQTAQQGSSEETAARKRVYSGYAELVVESVEKTKQVIMDTALETGGYIEAVSERFVVIRVPVERFADVFAGILLLGTVRRQSVETVDVTEAFTDLSTRLSIAQKTRERLYALLQKTESVQERLNILREIRRLTEEIERIGTTLAALEKSIAFSRIQVSLIPRIEEEPTLRGEIPFPWIADLNPLYASASELKPKTEIRLSESFAVFTGLSYFGAESADGTRVRITSRENAPKGDALFWQKALLHHLRPFYRTAEAVEGAAGTSGFRGAVFTSKDREPYTYLGAVWISGNSIVVAEAFFPNRAARDAHYQSIVEALEAAEVGK